MVIAKRGLLLTVREPERVPLFALPVTLSVSIQAQYAPKRTTVTPEHTIHFLFSPFVPLWGRMSENRLTRRPRITQRGMGPNKNDGALTAL